MTEYTDEELEKMVSERIAAAQAQQHSADMGVIGFTMSLEYLADQVNRKVIPEDVYLMMDRIYHIFRIDVGLDKSTPPKEPSEQKQ